MEEKMMHVSSSPHVRAKLTTRSIMYDVAIALMPAAIYGCVHFGLHAFLVVLASITTCVVTEYIWQKLMHKKLSVSDGSALVTGLLIAMNMPPQIPLWIPMLGGVFAIIIVKQLFGGLGQNFMNPALAARCFLLISFAGPMTDFAYAADAVSSATPLAIMKDGGSVEWIQMFFGNTGGTIGEVSAFALLIGAAYLLAKKIISWRIPVSYIGTFAIFMFLFSGRGTDGNYMLGQIFGGGLMLGAFFMATDYVTSPITKAGKIYFGILLGLLTGVIRVFGNASEGVSYAIIIGNLLVPLIEKISRPKAFGYGREAKHGR